MEDHHGFQPFSFLDSLTKTEWQKLLAISNQHSYKKGNCIFKSTELNNAFFILLSGRSKVVRLSSSGREFIQWFCLPGEVFGVSEDNLTSFRGLDAYALSDITVLSIPKTDFNNYLMENPRLSFLIIKQISTRLRTLGDMLESVANNDAKSRLINLLQRLSSCYGVEYQHGVHIDVHLTHQEMADMIGVCRQTVSSMLGELKNDGILEASRSGIHIQSSKKLDCYFSHPQ